MAEEKTAKVGKVREILHIREQRKSDDKRSSKRLNRSRAGNVMIFLCLLFFGSFMALPIVYAIVQAFKPMEELFIFPPRFFVTNPTTENFRLIGQLIGSLWVPASRYLFNSIFVSVVGTAGNVLISSMAAYPLAKHDFPGKKALNRVVTVSLLFSGGVISLAQYIVIARLGLINTYWALILPTVASSMGLFLMKQFMVQINDSLLEAARIDGMNEFQIFIHIVMPLVKPAWLTQIIFAFQGIWSNPPFGGMRYDDYSPNETLEERTRFNASDLKSYDAAPYGELTKFTEPIVQTRAMAVLDDAIVLFDYLKGEQNHRYENLFQIKGFLNLESAEDGSRIRYTGHTGQKTTNVLSDAQFITDCSWYETEGVSVARFNTCFGEGSDMRGTRMGYCEPGDLHMDVYTAWPPKTVQCLGLVAEDHGIRIPYHAKITADWAVLEEITANALLLGARKIDVSCAPTKEMKLHIENGPVYTEQLYPRRSRQGLFLGGACVEFEDGSTAPLSECELVFQNIDEGYGIGKDYEGGRVLIEGEEYADALPVSPLDHDAEGLICVKSIKPIVRLTGILGADSFPGPEQQRRRTYAIRQEGETAKYITVIEPYESNAVIRGVSAADEDTVIISYADGRKDTLHISGMETGKIAISLIRENDSGEVYHETTITA